MDKRTIARVLEEIGTLLELQGENPFRARAFQTAARTIEGLEGDVAAMAESGALARVRGLGPATLQVVRELLDTGESSVYRELREATPPGLLDLLRVPGLGARRIHVLHVTLGISSLDDLERAATEGRIAELSGFGAKTQAKLLEGIAFLRSVSGRRLLPDAMAVAAWLVDAVRSLPEVQRAEAAGEVRRRLETVGAIDIVASVPGGAGRAVVDAFLTLPEVVGGTALGENGARARLTDGLELRLRCVPPESFAAAFVHVTGGAEHVAGLAAKAESAGLRLDEHGLWRGGERVELADEAALYGALGLDFVPPELRETGDEVAAASAGSLPALLEPGHLRGCFHNHTTYSDGHATLREMAEAALRLGWRYLGIADHSQFAAYAKGLSPDAIARQHEEIDAWNAERGHELWLFKGIEADILPDGRLDYADLDEDILARFDYVVGSVHSSFGMSEAEMTERVLRAMENPHLTFLGHPTGRLLLGRGGYRIDMEAVVEAAAERGVGIEINANPHRLDMDWRYWRRAKEKGIRTAINPDAHSVDGLEDVRWGVMVARKGWLTAADVVNAWDLDAVREYFRKRKTS